MEAFLILLTGQSENIIYFLLFCVLFFSGLGLPVPEDAVLLSGGFLLYFGYTDFLPTVLVGFFGVVCGDTLIFHIGKRWGTDAVRHRSLARLLTPGRLARVQRYFQKYGSMTILLARFLVVLRAPTFLLAGSMYMPFR
ncbi:MAG: DedA family protein, partial [Nitrospinota bacterium]